MTKLQTSNTRSCRFKCLLPLRKLRSWIPAFSEKMFRGVSGIPDLWLRAVSVCNNNLSHRHLSTSNEEPAPRQRRGNLPGMFYIMPVVHVLGVVGYCIQVVNVKMDTTTLKETKSSPLSRIAPAFEVVGRWASCAETRCLSDREIYIAAAEPLNNLRSS